MREINWLGPLQMGVAGHQHVGIFLRQKEERVLQRAETCNDLVNFFPDVEVKIERDLIVAAAPVCNLAPAGPIRLVNAASMFICTSSSDWSQTNLPAAISFSISRKPRAIISNSSAERIPALARAEACAMDPAISCW